MAHYYGVRHLSPACAHYVTQFLDEVKPKAVLIEGPSDLSELIKPLCGKDVTMPAAILAYTAKAPVHTVLYPMAEFSPEYRAMKWACGNGAEVMFCDLPSYCLLAKIAEEEEKKLRESEEQSGESEEPEEEQSEVTDKEESVYTKMEKLTGIDNDTYWEYTFEHCKSYEEFVPVVYEYGKGLREFSSDDDTHNALREAFMRKTVHEAELKYGADKVAVITGAFHTGGLKDRDYTEEDTKITKILPKIESKATLMPYSYYRLSARSGYGAGSKAPGYYEMLWKARQREALDEVGAEYLSRLAEFQRKSGFAASSAEVIEALRLARTLSEMRGGNMPSMSDLRDAAVACMGHGSFGEISLACADTEIGTKIGTLPDGTVCTSVQEDFMRQLSALSLKRFRSVAAEDLKLDLRENLRAKTEKSAFLDLNRSFFLHRTRVLDIGFGTQQATGQQSGTWSELWSLKWTPESEIRLVEASLKGDTIEQAAAQELNSRLLSAQNLKTAAAALSDAFMCGLADIAKTAVSAVQAMAAENVSIADTGATIGELAGIYRFGNIRKIDTEPLMPLIKQLILRFCLGIGYSSVCDDEAANEIVNAIHRVNDACLSLDLSEDDRFLTVLEDLADSDMANPLISGFACAVLLERGKITNEKLSELISRRLSHGTPPADGALWFEGLARKNRRSLISRLSVWEKLCGFISVLGDEEFKPALICLRRTFAEFSPSEKSDIAENIGEVLGISAQQAAEFITSKVSDEEQQTLDELDDFDFGDI